MGKRAEAQRGVSRTEAQIWVVVNEACGDDDMVCGSGQMPRCVPRSLEKAGTLKGGALDQSTETLKNGMVVVRVQGGIGPNSVSPVQ